MGLLSSSLVFIYLLLS